MQPIFIFRSSQSKLWNDHKEKNFERYLMPKISTCLIVYVENHKEIYVKWEDRFILKKEMEWHKRGHIKKMVSSLNNDGMKWLIFLRACVREST